MNSRLDKLSPYPFQKLNKLKSSGVVQTDLEHIPLSVGEPKHPAPECALEALTSNLDAVTRYPSTRGTSELRRTLADWLCQRFSLDKQSFSADKNVLPVNGTREALFAIAQTLIDPASEESLIISPNPFYQIYEGAGIMSGAAIHMMNCEHNNNFLPNLDDLTHEVLSRCELMYLCTPGNPTGAVMSIAYLQKAIKLAREFDFVLVSDECYSELYYQKAPPGLLEAAHKLQPGNYQNCLAFHSLSKRSNLPGLRSGLVAGDEKLLDCFFQYRTYHGSAMSELVQLASIAAWSDESHVEKNRQLYSEKFDLVLAILKDYVSLAKPEAGFYLWLDIRPFYSESESGLTSDECFARDLFLHQHITVLPGSYLSRDVNGTNPGEGYVRLALVAPKTKCIEAANRINQFLTARRHAA